MSEAKKFSAEILSSFIMPEIAWLKTARKPPLHLKPLNLNYLIRFTAREMGATRKTFPQTVAGGCNEKSSISQFVRLPPGT